MRRPPKCNSPVGLGANLTRTGIDATTLQSAAIEAADGILLSVTVLLVVMEENRRRLNNLAVCELRSGLNELKNGLSVKKLKDSIRKLLVRLIPLKNQNLNVAVLT